MMGMGIREGSRGRMDGWIEVIEATTVLALICGG
jgi:hypothetical protein